MYTLCKLVSICCSRKKEQISIKEQYIVIVLHTDPGKSKQLVLKI